MKFIHTSDLHLGKKLYETPMIEDQEYILEQILEIVKKEKADAILIPGDIYDRSVAPEEALTLFSNFLKGLHSIGCKAYIIPGNHDSSERVAFANSILSEQDIFISSSFKGKMERYEVEDEYGKLNIWLLPFFRDVSVNIPEGKPVNTNNAFITVLENSGVDGNERNILLSHQYFTGGEVPKVGGSEKFTPTKGLEECISYALLTPFDYAALGHIHKSQIVGKENYRYSGTPLKYSETETFEDKSVIVVDVKGKGDVEIKEVPLVPLRDLRVIEGTVDTIIDSARSSNANNNDFVYIKLTEPALDAKQKLSQVYPNILSIVMSNYVAEDSLETKSIEEIRRTDPIELFREMYLKMTGSNMSEEQERIFRDAVEKAKEEVE